MIEEASEESGVAGVVDVELVEEEQASVLGDVVDRALDGVSFAPVIVDVAVEFVEEAMELHSGSSGSAEAPRRRCLRARTCLARHPRGRTGCAGSTAARKGDPDLLRAWLAARVTLAERHREQNPSEQQRSRRPE